MTEDTARTAHRLWTSSGFREDEWAHAETADALAGNGRFILPISGYLALEQQDRDNARERLGVSLQPGDELTRIEPHLGELALVALAFPAFSDGRSFSKAELLRTRHGFKGAVRAYGQVLPDQFSHMLRTGFDEFEITHPVLIRRLESGDLGGLDLYYQPTGKPDEKAEEKYSWRRKPSAG